MARMNDESCNTRGIGLTPIPQHGETGAPEAARIGHAPHARSISGHMSEQRERERFNVKFNAVAHELDDTGMVARSVPAQVSDISQAGMGAVVEGLIHVGRRVLVQVDFSPEPKWFLAETARVHYEVNVGHRVGLKLLELPESGPIAQELARLQRSNAA